MAGGQLVDVESHARQPPRSAHIAQRLIDDDGIRSLDTKAQLRLTRTSGEIQLHQRGVELRRAGGVDESTSLDVRIAKRPCHPNVALQRAAPHHVAFDRGDVGNSQNFDERSQIGLVDLRRSFDRAVQIAPRRDDYRHNATKTMASSESPTAVAKLERRVA